MNLANKITVLRIFLTFLFIILALSDSLILTQIAFFVGVLAGISDFFDGYIARKYNIETDFGVFIDPLADKIFISSAFVILLHKGVVPPSIVLIVLIREFIVTGLRLIAIQKNIVIAANIGGKIKTTVQLVYLAIAGATWVEFIPENEEILSIFMYATFIITAYTGIDYLICYSKLYKNNL